MWGVGWVGLGWVDVALIVCDAKALTESELELIRTVKSTATTPIFVLRFIRLSFKKL